VVLRGVADLLRAQLRATDVAGRYGGEEFLILLAQNGTRGGEVLSERWRRAVEGAAFRGLAGEEIRVTISLGVASRTSRHASPEDLIAEADAALYRAKEAGRNRIEGSDDELPTLISTGPAPAANRLPGASLQPGLSSSKGVLMAAPASGG
jgi:diguanylate cyclase (GGDEF)-like protein